VPAKKDYSAPSVFEPKALLREARRQKGIATKDVPRLCILDPDGDIVSHLRRQGRARPFPEWPCYHTDMDAFELGGETAGIVGRAVGAPFAVLIAEQLFASGCQLLVSVTSAGQINAMGEPPYFVLIDKALRDEGTSHHYAPAAEFADADPALIAGAERAAKAAGLKTFIGASWTTDAPFRETAQAIADARARGVLAVEMEAAALYTFGRVARTKVLCIAHVTNTMGQAGQDFEKGEAGGAAASLRLLASIAAELG
jgi:uridine phosphorylase